MKTTINEIVIGADGACTVIGEIAHKLHAAGKGGKLKVSAAFQVWECVTGGEWVLRAAQSTREGAERYWTGGRVLVCDTRVPVEVAPVFGVGAQVRVDCPGHGYHGKTGCVVSVAGSERVVMVHGVFTSITVRLSQLVSAFGAAEALFGSAPVFPVLVLVLNGSGAVVTADLAKDEKTLQAFRWQVTGDMTNAGWRVVELALSEALAFSSLLTFVGRISDGGHGASDETARCAFELLASLGLLGDGEGAENASGAVSEQMAGVPAGWSSVDA